LPTQATKEGLLRFLKACPNLENLTLSGCAAVDDEVVNAITRRNLHTLDLTNCERITDSGVKSLARCTKLTNLRLSKCNVSDDAVSHLVRGFDKVEAIFVHGIAPHESEYSGCKQLETLVLDGIQWRTNVSDTALIAIGEQCPRLTTLFAWDCHSVTDAGVMALAQGCPLLHTFATNRCENLDAGIGALQTLKLTHLKLGRCALTSMWVAPLLETLELSNCPNLAEVFAIARATGLTSLDLTNSPRVTDADISLIAKKCPRLSDLNLDGCNLISDTTLVALGEHCPRLSSLRLWDLGAGVSDAGIIKLADGCRQLSTFTLGNCERLTDAENELSRLPLTVLELMRYRNPLQVDDLIMDPQPYLTELRLIDCRRLIAVDGISFAPQLTWLQLKNCRVVRDRHIRAIARGCPRLLHLDVSYCPRVKEGIEAVAQHCQDLTTLYVDSTGVGDEQMHALIQCRRLTDLDVSGCPISDAAAFSIAQMPLRRLALTGTPITDAFVGAVAQGCPALETLYVANSAITDVGFAAIAQHCDNLQYLDLRNTQVTGAGLRAFAEWEFESFNYLDISHCSKIFADAVEAVQFATGWDIRSEGIVAIREDSSDSEGEDEEDGIWEV
jgi:Leucine-rich repeat (LRR) protein